VVHQIIISHLLAVVVSVSATVSSPYKSASVYVAHALSQYSLFNLLKHIRHILVFQIHIKDISHTVVSDRLLQDFNIFKNDINY